MPEQRQPPTIRFGETEYIPPDRIPTLVLETLSRQHALEEHGQHRWFIAVLYYLDDPAQALDDMSLGYTNMLGVTVISCLWCGDIYTENTDPETPCRADRWQPTQPVTRPEPNPHR